MLNVQRRRVPGVSSVDTMSRITRSNTTPDLRSAAQIPSQRLGRDSGTPTGGGSRDSYPVSFSDVWWLDRHGVPIPSSNVRYKGNTKSFRSLGRLGDQRTSQQTSSLPSVDSAGRARSAPKQRPLGNIRPPNSEALKLDDNNQSKDPGLLVQAKGVLKTGGNRRPNSHEGSSKTREYSGHLGSTALDPQPPRVSREEQKSNKPVEHGNGYGFNTSFIHRDRNGQIIHQQQPQQQMQQQANQQQQQQQEQQQGEPKLLYIKDNQFRPHRPRRPSPASNSADKQMKFRASDPKVSTTRGQYTSRGIQPVKKRAALTSKEKLQKANLSLSEFYSVGIENLLDQRNRHVLPALKKTGSSDSLSITVQSENDYLEWGDLKREATGSRRSRSKRSVRFNTDPKVHEYEPYDGWEKPETDTYFLSTTSHK